MTARSDFDAVEDDRRLLIDADQAAALLAISRRQVYMLARAHAIPHVRVGRYLRFRLRSLERWIDDQEEASTRYEGRG
jgi:excisionase family DNA binding protein